MFQALVITLREGVEAALVLSIAATLLRKRGLEKLQWALYAGAAVAIVLAVVVGFTISRLTFNEELVEGIVMLVGAALVLSLVWWMWLSASRMKDDIQEGVDRATRNGNHFGNLLGLFVFAFGMVFREGAETAIFLSVAGFNTEGLGLWIGAVAGLVLAAAFGVAFMRGSLRMPLKPFFSITTAVLLLIAAQLLVGGFHELSEAEVIPASRTEMAIIGPIVKSELLLFTLTVALAAAWLLFGRWSEPAPAGAPATGPQARLERASRARETGTRRALGVLGLLIVGFLTVAYVQGSSIPEKAPATPVAIAGGAVRFAAAPTADGRMHYYQATLGDQPVRFFAIQVGEELKTCFDACEICGDIGYFEEDGAAVCRNCTSPIPLTTLGRTGGCNPIPLAHRREGDSLVVAEADLRAVLPHLQGR